MAHIWTEEELRFLREYVPGHHYAEIRAEMEKLFDWSPTKAQLSYRISKSGLRCGVVPSSRYPKGHVPVNKGTKGVLKANSTSFKKGHRPAGYRPVGSTRINSDGYHETKVADPRTWKQTHRLIWEAAHGPIPKGYIVVFKDQDRSNLQIDNLMLITRAQNVRMNQNGLFFSDSELTETGANIASLMCSMSKAKKERGGRSGRHEQRRE